MPESFNEKAVFLVALQLPPEERESYLQLVCPDESAAARVRSLLAHHKAEAEPPEAAPPPSLAAGQTLGEFTIIRLLGEGGMGTVYLAEEPALARRVALKVLNTGVLGGETFLARFREEAQRTAALKHPGIVNVHRFGYDGERHYIVSEYVEGPTLRAVIDSRASTADAAETRSADAWRRKCADTIASIADALDYCHRRGVIHRDVKPSNILIDQEQGPRLTDFGIARDAADGTRYDQTALIGSCHYMSPEQASAASIAVDRRTDVFSLGVVLYEMLLLRKPFDAKDAYGVLRCVIADPPARPRSIDPRFPRQLEIVVLKALEKDPVHRYQSAAHLSADLRSWLNGDPVLASPPTPLRRARQAIRRRRVPVAIGMTAVLAALLGAWFYDRSIDDRPRVSTVDFPSGATLHVQPWSQEGAGFGPPRRLGSASGGTRRADPGLSRFTVSVDSDHFTELVRRLEPGQATALSARLRSTAEATEDMVLIRPAPGDERIAPGMVPAPFWIDAHEVTNAQYAAFLAASPGTPPPPLWESRQPPQGWDQLPVVGVTIGEARAFAEWSGKRLPTSAEWRHAVHATGEGTPAGWAGSTDPPAATGEDVPTPRQLWVTALDASNPTFRPTPDGPTQAEMRVQRIDLMQRAVAPVAAAGDPPLPVQLTDNVLEWTDTPRWIELASNGGQVFAAMGDRRVRLAPGQSVNLGECEALVTEHSRLLVVGFRCARSAAPASSR